MRPITHHIKLFTLERVVSIRLNRELSIGDERTKFITKKSKKSSTVKKVKKIELNAKARAAMESMDPATRAFLEAQM